MSFLIDPTVPANSEAIGGGLGASRIRNISGWMLQIFGFSGAIPETFPNNPFAFDVNNLITVQGDPISSLGIATKHYVDQGSSSPTATISNGGSGSAFTGNLTPGISAYGNLAEYRVKWSQASQGNDTVALNGLPAVTMKKNLGGALVNLSANDIPAGATTDIIYDGTFFQLGNPVGSPASCTITNGGSGAAFTGTLIPGILSYVLYAQYVVKWTQASQGNDTIALNGLSALTVKKNVGGTLVNLVAGDVPAGAVTQLLYDGANLQMSGGTPATEVAGGYASENISSGAANTSAFTNLTGTLALTAPASGGPFRLMISYYVPMAGGGSNANADFRATDGTNFWAFCTRQVTAGGHEGANAADFSPVTYPNGTVISINVQAWAGSAMTLGGTSAVGAQQAVLKGWFIPST